MSDRRAGGARRRDDPSSPKRSLYPMNPRPLLALLLPLAACLSSGRATAATPAPAAATACSVRAEPGDDLQAAVDRVPNDGKPATVCLSAGDFHVTKLLSIQRDGLRLRGQGDATVLRMRDGVQQRSSWSATTRTNARSARSATSASSNCRSSAAAPTRNSCPNART